MHQQTSRNIGTKKQWLRLLLGFAATTALFGIWLIPTAEAAVSTDSLVGYWKFDEGTGTLAADSSGHGNNSTAVVTRIVL